MGDHDGDWDIDFVDYAYFIANYPGIDIAPVTGSAPYFFPNFDGISDEKDLNMFQSQWNWSLDQMVEEMNQITLNHQVLVIDLV